MAPSPAGGFCGNDILAVPADLTNVLAVATGGYHNLAMRRDGTVVGWGFAGAVSKRKIHLPAILRAMQNSNSPTVSSLR